MSEPLKGISLHQPYATGMALGVKTVETRSWPTSHRGPLAIQAAKADNHELRAEFVRLMSIPRNLEVFRNAGIRTFDDLPFGALVGVGNVVAVIPTSIIRMDTEKRMVRVLGIDQWEIEKHWGNFGPARFLWHIEEMDAFPTPIPYRGYQGLFDVQGVTV